MKLYAFAALYLIFSNAHSAIAEQSFAEATNTMENLLRKKQIEPGDVVAMKRVLSFVSENLPPTSLPQSYGSQSSEQVRVRYECRRVWFCDPWGGTYWRDVWVRVQVKEQPKKTYGAQTPLRLALEELQNAVANFPKDPGVNLRDLALQVYGVTLTSDIKFQAGKINR